MVTAEQRGAEIGGATMYGREFGPAGPLGRVLTNSAKGNSMSASARKRQNSTTGHQHLRF